MIRTRERQPFLTSRFQISAKPGDIIYFNRSTWGECYGRFTIYDGFDSHHILYENLMTAGHSVPIEKSTLYFQAHVLIRFHNLDKKFDQQWEMYFKRVRNIGIQVNNTLHFTVENIEQSKAVNLAFIVNFTHNELRPKLSIRSRIFNGFNEDNCVYGGIIITQARDGDMLSNDTYGPYCNSLAAETLFLTSVGTTNITFSGEPFVMFVYAFNPLYNMDLDLAFTMSQCNGILNPVKLCPNPLNMSSTVIEKYAKYNYVVSCAPLAQAAKGSVAYLEITVRRIAGCLVIQQIPAPLDINYSLLIRGQTDVRVYISTPRLPQHVLDRTVWDVAYLHIRSNIIRQTGNKHLSYTDLPLIYLFYLGSDKWHKLVYNLEIHSKIYIPKCGIYNETSHTLWKFSQRRDRYVLAVTEKCGTGRYLYDHIYMYSFLKGSRTIFPRNRKSITYISITKTYSDQCFLGNLSSAQEDLISIVLNDFYTSTIPVQQESYYITFYNTHTILVYEKNIRCSLLQINYGYGIFQMYTINFILPSTVKTFQVLLRELNFDYLNMFQNFFNTLNDTMITKLWNYILV